MKLKRPFHLVVSSLRVDESERDSVSPMNNSLATLGHQSFAWDTPDGYPDKIEYWAGNIAAAVDLRVVAVAHRTRRRRFSSTPAPYRAGSTGRGDRPDRPEFLRRRDAGRHAHGAHDVSPARRRSPTRSMRELIGARAQLECLPVVLTRSMTMSNEPTRRRLRLSGIQRAVAPPVPRRGGAGTVGAACSRPGCRRSCLAKTYASNRDVIVSIFLRGGADGLSLCRAVRRSGYYTSRPTIAIPRPDSTRRDKGIDLDGFFAFAAGMSGLVPAYHAQDLLVVHATGSDEQHALALRRAAVHGGRQAGRSELDHRLARPTPRERAAAASPAHCCAASASRTVFRRRSSARRKTLPIADPANFSIGGSATTQPARLAFMQSDYAAGDEPLRSAALDAMNTVELLKSVNFTGYVPANGAMYPNSAFGRALARSRC